jgi:hypothetical protein
MKRAIAALLCAFLLTGCGRAADRRAAHDTPVSPPATTATTGATTANGVGSGGTGKNADTDIASTDGLLNQLDAQVNADAQPAQDAD